MLLFKRPHVLACEDHVDIVVKLENLRQLRNYEDFLQLLRVELEEVYGAAPSAFHNPIRYSTREAPYSFSFYFGGHQQEMLRKYDASVEKALQLSTVYKKALEEHELLLGEYKNTKRTQRKEREKAKAERRLKEMQREVLSVEYEVVCLSKKLTNVFEIHTIRVPLA